jgi:hypothetical protein
LYQDKKVVIANEKIGRLLPDPLGKFSLFDLQVK